MKALRLISFFAGLVLVLVSCEKPQPEPTPEKLTVSVSPSSLELSAEGGTATFSVTCKGMWYARTSASWIQVSPASGSGNGTVTVIASTNAADARTASVSVETVDDQKAVSVLQQMYVKPVPVTKTIREVRALYKGKDYKIVDDIYIEGVIISDFRKKEDGGLHNYTSAKTMILSDGEAGLMLRLKEDNKDILRGQKVSVSLKDLSLSVYNGGPLQISDIPRDRVTLGGKETPAPREITVRELLTGNYECTYVAVKDVQVKAEYLNHTFGNADNHTSIPFEGKEGGEFDLFTSKLATFINEKVPSGSGTLKGIAGVFGTRCQIYISEKSDYAGLTGERFAPGAEFSLASSGGTVSGDAGSFGITLVSNVEWKASSSDPDITVSPASGTKGTTVTVSYKSNPSTAESRTARILFTTEDAGVAQKELVFTLTQLPLDKVFPSQVQAWMELPAVPAEEGKAFFSHDMVYGGETVRNYSFWYDLENRVSLWVAYPLVKGHISGVKRTDKWGYDPLVPHRYQGEVSYSYAGYDRGHQIPSADRLCSAEANEQTFYYTNIAPQNKNFNQGIWEKLEVLVRNQVSDCDTVYVVTGCVLSTDEDPTIVYAKDTEGKNVAVPQVFYKVLLRYKAGAANGGYSGIGFWLENRSYGSEEISRSHACTIDQIESRVGIDFFVNLKDEYEKEAEAKFDAGTWGL
ncbi:MAG: DNA/RNA non-specific endonuclease [Bacteroidales bacterium]|nr:DNA/RNA non-specific endonuclease [Bacteroidales bacterium]